MPYTLSWSYRTLRPPTDPKAPCGLPPSSATSKRAKADTVKLTDSVENVSGKGQGMAVAVLGCPPACHSRKAPLATQGYGPVAARRQKTRQYRRLGAYEAELVLNWRDLQPKRKSRSSWIELRCQDFTAVRRVEPISIMMLTTNTGSSR